MSAKKRKKKKKKQQLRVADELIAALVEYADALERANRSGGPVRRPKHVKLTKGRK